jgi:hypothetical protein
MLSKFLTSLFTLISFSNLQSAPSTLTSGFAVRASQSDQKSTITLGAGALFTSSN